VAALGHNGLPCGGANDEGATGIRFWSSPKTERRRGGGAVRVWTVGEGRHLGTSY
jgi:hypothetical protein